MKDIFLFEKYSFISPCSTDHSLADLSRTSSTHHSSVAVLQLDCSFLENERFQQGEKGEVGRGHKEAEGDNIKNSSHEKPSVPVVFIHTNHPSEVRINAGYKLLQQDIFEFVFRSGSDMREWGFAFIRLIVQCSTFKKNADSAFDNVL